jgi:4,5-DOPA dioxygenase extradiol
VSAISKPNLVYDFYGFPTELYKVVCPATGDEKIAEEICALEKTIQRDTERGLDHGVWTVLMHLFPQANIPVLQISIDYENSRRSQYELMKNLRPLRNQGVLFMGSGNIIHNLGLLRAGQPYDWAIEFDALSKKHISEHNIDALFNREAQGSIAELAIPTDDHYRPMLNTLALMDDTESILFFNEEIDLGSIGMRSFITRAT